MHEAATMAGGTNIAKTLPAAFTRVGVETLVAGKPEVIVMSNEAKNQSFWRKPPWSGTPAAKNGKLFFLPPAEKDPLARPALRMIDGLFWLGTILHPELTGDLSKWRAEAAATLNLQREPSFR